jgi:hypothetical protein
LAASKVKPKIRWLDFTRPLIGRVLADPLDAGKAALADFASQGGMPFGIGLVVKDLAEWVASRDVRAAVDAVALLDGGQRRAGFAHPQGERLFAMHPGIQFPDRPAR